MMSAVFHVPLTLFFLALLYPASAMCQSASTNAFCQIVTNELYYVIGHKNPEKESELISEDVEMPWRPDPDKPHGYIVGGNRQGSIFVRPFSAGKIYLKQGAKLMQVENSQPVFFENPESPLSGHTFQEKGDYLFATRRIVLPVKAVEKNNLKGKLLLMIVTEPIRPMPKIFYDGRANVNYEKEIERLEKGLKDANTVRK